MHRNEILPLRLLRGVLLYGRTVSIFHPPVYVVPTGSVESQFDACLYPFSILTFLRWLGCCNFTTFMTHTHWCNALMNRSILGDWKPLFLTPTLYLLAN